MDTFIGTGEGVIYLTDNPYDTVSHGLGCSSLSSEIVDELDSGIPSMLSNWERQQKMHICMHTEIRVILRLGLPLANEWTMTHPIGVSKRSCLWRTLWIQSHFFFSFFFLVEHIVQQLTELASYIGLCDGDFHSVALQSTLRNASRHTLLE